MKEYELFRAAYCGLCHALGKRCGFASCFTVNYDFTFLAMLISEPETDCFLRKRCIAHPIHRRICCRNERIDDAADYSLILTWWKLRDTVADGNFCERLRARAALVFLYRPYKRAAARLPAFSCAVQTHLAELAALEKQNEPSIDRTADCFAGILAAVAEDTADMDRLRILRQIFYHTGRLIYLLDAVDDLAEDLQEGRYNPLRFRFGLEGRMLTDAEKEELRLTMRHSLNMLGSAFELLPGGVWTGILANIVYLGIPAACEQVLSGIWQKRVAYHTPRSII